MSKPSLNSISSKVIGELEPVTEDAVQLAEIGAALPSQLEVVVVRDRSVIGRFYAPNTAGYLLTNSYVNQDALEAVQRLIIQKLGTEVAKISMSELCSAAEAMKNLVNASVGNGTMQLKALETLAFSNKKKNRTANAPQAIITGANPQIVVSGDTPAAA